MASVLTVDQACETLGVSRKVLYAHIASGRLPAVNVGMKKTKPRYRITEEAIAAFLASNPAAPKKDGGE